MYRYEIVSATYSVSEVSRFAVLPVGPGIDRPSGVISAFPEGLSVERSAYSAKDVGRLATSFGIGIGVKMYTEANMPTTMAPEFGRVASVTSLERRPRDFVLRILGQPAGDDGDWILQRATKFLVVPKIRGGKRPTVTHSSNWRVNGSKGFWLVKGHPKSDLDKYPSKYDDAHYILQQFSDRA